MCYLAYSVRHSKESFCVQKSFSFPASLLLSLISITLLCFGVCGQRRQPPHRAHTQPSLRTTVRSAPSPACQCDPPSPSWTCQPSHRPGLPSEARGTKTWDFSDMVRGPVPQKHQKEEKTSCFHMKGLHNKFKYKCTLSIVFPNTITWPHMTFVLWLK